MGSSSKIKGHYQIRSISLPCRSHPSTLRLEEEFNKLKAWDGSSAPTAKTISNDLSRLEDLYKCMEDLLNLPLTQQAISHHQHKKWVDDLQELFVRILDVCSAARDVTTQIKEHVRDLQSALRRRKGDSSIQSSIAKYISFRKNTKKEAKKLIIALMKQMDEKIEATPLQALREVGVVSISILHRLLLCLTVPILKPRSMRRSMVSKLLHRGVVACENQEEKVNELERVDIALQSLCRSHSSEGDNMQIAQNRLKSLEAGIEDVENVLECLFRRFIKAKATLLNIVSQ